MSRFGKLALGTALKRYKKQSFCIKDMPQTVEQFNDSPVVFLILSLTHFWCF
jgi:hypothetical protein